jgi:hypothetical protein
MKFNLLKKSILVLITIFSISCSKDEKETTQTVATITKCTLILKKTNGEVVPGVTVYAYSQGKWDAFGDNSNFADGQVASDATGTVAFSNIEYTATFTEGNNNQNNFRFSAYYSVNGVNRKKVTTITFNKGDQKTQTVILD